MKAQLRKGVVELCVLAIIGEKDCYGYEVVNLLKDVLDVSESTIYPILRRLTKGELLTTYLVESPSGPARKYYRITAQGKYEYATKQEEYIKFNQQVLKIIGGKS